MQIVSTGDNLHDMSKHDMQIVSIGEMVFFFFFPENAQ